MMEITSYYNHTVSQLEVWDRGKA